MTRKVKALVLTIILLGAAIVGIRHMSADELPEAQLDATETSVRMVEETEGSELINTQPQETQPIPKEKLVVILGDNASFGSDYQNTVLVGNIQEAKAAIEAHRNVISDKIEDYVLCAVTKEASLTVFDNFSTLQECFGEFVLLDDAWKVGEAAFNTENPVKMHFVSTSDDTAAHMERSLDIMLRGNTNVSGDIHKLNNVIIDLRTLIE